jgi:uncharacterized protein (TIGR03435 family)
VKLAQGVSLNPPNICLRERAIQDMSKQQMHKLNFSKKLLLAMAGAFAMTVPVAFGLVQARQIHAPAPSGDAKTFAYEVVSIRISKPSNTSSWNPTDDGFVMSGIDARSLVMSAYDLIADDQVAGLPAWTDSDRFDIQAKMETGASEALKKLPQKERDRQRGLMLQAVLEERFHLKIRRETREIPVYVLVLVKGGARLKETPASTPMGYTVNGGSDGQVLNGHGIEIKQLASSLSGTVGRLIVDKTGLSGKYDMDLKWSSEDNPGSADSSPSIFTALQEQLGLKLESTKAPVETIVVEHIDKPSDN